MVNFVDVKDIQVVNVRDTNNPNVMNKIRKAWVKSLSDNDKQNIVKLFPVQEVRFAYYKSIDSAVMTEWLTIMKNHFNDSIKNGAKIIVDKNGGERLEDAYCVDSDTQLICAAQNIVIEMNEEIKNELMKKDKTDNEIL